MNTGSRLDRKRHITPTATNLVLVSFRTHLVNPNRRDQRDRIDVHLAQYVLPHPFGRYIEHGRGRQRRHDPGALREFHLELPAAPSRIAEKNPEILRRMQRQTPQDIERTREAQIPIDAGYALGVWFDLRFEAVLKKDPTGIRLDGSAPSDLCFRSPPPLELQTLTKFAHGEFDLPIQNQSKSRFSVMMDHEHHRAPKIRVGELGHGNE